MSMPPFHLAFPVIDLETTRAFYAEVLGCEIGREDTRWIDFCFFGHQITAHLVEKMPSLATNSVDGKAVPSNHFGAILEWQEWQALAEKMRHLQVKFLIEPYLRFEGLPGEQATMFLIDPSGNGLEFKAFKNPSQIFATS